MERTIIEYELADGTVDQVRIINPSLVSWDETSVKRGWPTRDKAGQLWATYVVWHSLTRTGRYAGKFEHFRDVDCIDLDTIEVDKKTGELPDQDPTQPAAESSTSSLSPSLSDPSAPAESLGSTSPTTP